MVLCLIMIELNEDLMRVLDVLPIPVVGWDEIGRIVYLNIRASTAFGWEEDDIMGVDIDEILGDSIKNEFLEPGRVQNGYEYSIVNRSTVKTSNGNEYICEWTSILFESTVGGIYGISIAKNISKMESMQKKMLESRRLATIGQLIGKIAHEINNLLMGVVGYLSIAKDETEGRKVRGDIDSALNTSKRIKSLVQSLLSQSRTISNNDGICVVDRVVGEVIEFSKKILPKRISIESELSNSNPKIKADDNLLHQILLNIILNARDAINGEGSIRVEVDTISRNSGCNPPYTEEDYVSISISDSGTGMSEEVREKIFEPFYTTKDKINGTGLGLYFVFDSIKSLNGQIEVESEVGVGTTFKIFIPIIKNG